MANLKLVVLFDCECTACSRFAVWIASLDIYNCIYFIPLQSNFGQIILNKLGLNSNYFDSIITINENQIKTHSKAFSTLGSMLPFPGKLLYLAKFIPQNLFDWIYTWLGKRRRKIKILECPIPTPEIRSRFTLNQVQQEKVLDWCDHLQKRTPWE